MKESYRSAPSSRQRFDHSPPPFAKDDAHGRTIGGKRPNRSERHAWRSESRTCKPHKQVTLLALPNEGIENNRSHIDPSRCRSSLSFGNLRKLSRPCVTDTWSARFALWVSVTRARHITAGVPLRDLPPDRIISGAEQPRAGTRFIRETRPSRQPRWHCITPARTSRVNHVNLVNLTF